MAGKPSLRRLTRSVFSTAAGLRALRAASPDIVTIFLWHSVGTTAAPFFDRAAMAAGESSHCPLDAFDVQVDWITQRFRVVPLADCIDVARSGERGRGWLAALTFDDGFRNVAEEAVPRLHARRLPCTMFLNAALADQTWVKDSDVEKMGAAAAGRSREAIAAETRAYAPWSLLRSLPASVSFGNHGARHLRLPRLSRAEAEKEIDEGRRAITTELGVERMPYAFTYGQPRDINDEARALALASHSAVLSAFGGSSWPGAALADLPRVPVFSSRSSKLLVEYAFPPRFLLERLRRFSG